MQHLRGEVPDKRLAVVLGDAQLLNLAPLDPQALRNENRRCVNGQKRREVVVGQRR